jgi:hypothetical protein
MSSTSDYTYICATVFSCTITQTSSICIIYAFLLLPENFKGSIGLTELISPKSLFYIDAVDYKCVLRQGLVD